MATMQSFIDDANARRGMKGNQRNGDFLPEDVFPAYADLDGSAARGFFESNGYKVRASGDMKSCGVAVTECGWTLSTNGYLSYSPAVARQFIERLEARA